MKKFKVNWPAIIAIVLAMSAISYHNEKKQEENRIYQAADNLTKIEQTLEEAKHHIEEVEIDKIIYPEEWQTEEKGFSK